MDKSIILCGYTSCGKTTIGKLLACRLNLAFCDTDRLLTETFQASIPEIFAKGGEALFRDLEYQIAKRVCAMEPGIISTGGGMVTFDRNGELLSRHGIVVHIHRPFEDCYGDLARQKDRPLVKNHTKEELHGSYLARIPTYRKYAAFTIENDGAPEDAVEKIIARVKPI